MIIKKLLHAFLYPVSALYRTGSFLYHRMYDTGVLKSTYFKSPATICVGNLSTGGTGKTPMVEFLIRNLKNHTNIAVLSRGYGRESSGFVEATPDYGSREIGDEPAQFKLKFPDVPVFVDESRVHGIKKIVEKYPQTKIVILDDAFQHRKIKAGINLLLTDYNHLFYEDELLPYGSLREPKSGYGRADVIVVTKTPEKLSPIEKKVLQKNIGVKEYQKIFFSFIQYGDLVELNGDRIMKLADLKGYLFLTLTGIANSWPLEDYLANFGKVETCSFSDHHEFTVEELKKVRKIFDNFVPLKKIIVTTEKDSIRLRDKSLGEHLDGLPIFYLPITMVFHDNREKEFLQIIENNVRTN